MDTIRKTSAEIIGNIEEQMHELERENTMQYEEKEVSATRQEKLEQDSAEKIDETLLLHGESRRFAIYQMDTGDEHTYQFMGFESAQKLGYTIEGKDYKMVYAAPWTPTITLEDIFERFNINRPNDFHGHSLSVSDVIVINRTAETKAYYVDSFGFEELPDFVQQRMEMLENNHTRAYPPVYKGTLAQAMEEQGNDCTILSGDRDTLQLITDHVTVRLVTNREDIDYTVQRFREEYGFYPISMIDLKALMGDASDNISGVSGIGPKTASTLIRSWSTVENVYDHIHQLNVSKMAIQKLIAGQESAMESKWLATIVKDAPVPTELQHYLPKPIHAREVRDLLMELEMVKLLDKLHLEAAADQLEEEPLSCAITPSIAIQQQPLTDALFQQWRIDLPTLCYELNLPEHRLQVLQEQTIYETTDEALIAAFLGSVIPKRTFGAKPHYRYMMQQGAALNNLVADGEIAAYLLNPASSEYTVARLSVTYHVLYDTALEDLAALVALPALCDAMEQEIQEQAKELNQKNLEEQAISLVGTDIYEKLVKGYTQKQWGRPCTELPAFIIKRLPVRFTYDNNYFNALYQGIPNGGYTAMVEKMLDGVEVRLNVDYLAEKEQLDKLADKVVYTGPVDAYFGYKLGALQYRSVRFETEVLDTDNYQGNAVVNYTDAETPYTRIIEHKHFEFGTQPKTVISREYSAEWKKGDEPYYPVNDEKNGALYAEYKKLADAEPGVIFGGRLGEYKYYDMDKVIEVALSVAEKELA